MVGDIVRLTSALSLSWKASAAIMTALGGLDIWAAATRLMGTGVRCVALGVLGGDFPPRRSVTLGRRSSWGADERMEGSPEIT